MADGVQFVIGSEVSCSDGPCGTLRRVVVDPVARRLTHLVVEPATGDALAARLVPVSLVEAGEGGEGGLRLACTRAELERLDPAEEEQFLPFAPGELGYGPGEALAFPYYGLGGLGAGSLGMNPGIGAAGLVTPGLDSPRTTIYDRVPVGDVEIRRGAEVHASDGRIGRVEGLVVDPADGAVTHVLLQEGHLWGKHDVAVPIAAVEEVVDDEVRLRLTKDEVRDLPPVELQRHD